MGRMCNVLRVCLSSLNKSGKIRGLKEFNSTQGKTIFMPYSYAITAFFIVFIYHIVEPSNPHIQLCTSVTDLSKNNITNITENNFRGQDNLLELDLSKNKILRMASSTFRHLTVSTARTFE